MRLIVCQARDVDQSREVGHLCNSHYIHANMIEVTQVSSIDKPQHLGQMTWYASESPIPRHSTTAILAQEDSMVKRHNYICRKCSSPALKPWLDIPDFVIVLVAIYHLSTRRLLMERVITRLPLSSSFPRIMICRVKTAYRFKTITNSHAAVSKIVIALATHMIP